MSQLNFERLYQFFSQIPSIQEQLIVAHGLDANQAWWFKFHINIQHPLAWQTVQELGHVLNYLSTNERLPTQFLPVSPPPYMNGGPQEFLAWVIQCNHPDFTPDVVCDWLEARLPQPVHDEKQWQIQTDLAELDQLTSQALDELIPPTH